MFMSDLSDLSCLGNLSYLGNLKQSQSNLNRSCGIAVFTGVQIFLHFLKFMKSLQIKFHADTISNTKVFN